MYPHDSDYDLATCKIIELSEYYIVSNNSHPKQQILSNIIIFDSTYLVPHSDLFQSLFYCTIYQKAY